MPEQTFQTQMDDLILTNAKLSNRITRLEKRMLVTQQAVHYLQLEKDGDSNDIMAKRNKRSK